MNRSAYCVAAVVARPLLTLVVASRHGFHSFAGISRRTSSERGNGSGRWDFSLRALGHTTQRPQSHHNLEGASWEHLEYYGCSIVDVRVRPYF